MERRIVVVLVLSAVAIGIAALLGAGGKDSSSSTSGISKDLNVRPVIGADASTPPTTLVTKDIVVGSGPAAKNGDKVTMRYAGVDYTTGKEFDASWNRPENAFPFTIGAGQVIPCWDKGVAGMQVGGRRELICPPDLAYGASGQPPAIGPNATLVFVVDLKKIG